MLKKGGKGQRSKPEEKKTGAPVVSMVKKKAPSSPTGVQRPKKGTQNNNNRLQGADHQIVGQTGAPLLGSKVAKQKPQPFVIEKAFSSDEESSDHSSSDENKDHIKYRNEESDNDSDDFLDDEARDRPATGSSSDLSDSEEDSDNNFGISSEKRRWLLGTEFPSDPSSEEEDAFDEALGRTPETRNTVGNIPMEYYENYDHIGYNIYGQKIAANTNKKDQIEEFLARLDDPNWKRTVRDLQNDKEVVLSREQYQLITNVLKQRFPRSANPYEVPDIPDDPADKIHPLIWATPRKESFLPVPKWELKKIDQLVKALERGQLVLDPKEKRPQQYFDLWEENTDENGFQHPGLLFPAPKMKLPGHAESYRPPSEYLFSKEEKEQWDQTDPEDRPLNFEPRSFSKMRQIPAYPELIKERYDRCIDLEMATRSFRKWKRSRDFLGEIEKLPAPSDFKPFPTHLALTFLGHTGFVRSISVDPTGAFLCSGSEDSSLRIWEISSGRCLKTFKFDSVVYSAQWNPSSDGILKNLVAAAVGSRVVILNADVGSAEDCASTDDWLRRPAERNTSSAETNSKAVWTVEEDPTDKDLACLSVQFSADIAKLSWHRKGDYLVSLSPESKLQREQVQIHQVSRKRSQMPFKKQQETVEHCQFHPTKPYLFVAFKTKVKVYNLAKVALEKTLNPGVRWISAFDIHPKGDNVILASYDKKVKWFDLDLSRKPYKHLSYHKEGVRTVAYHRKYPLFASGSDDMTLHIFHGQVYDDFTKNALIVPLKVLRGHQDHQSLGVFDLVWHPHQPWLFSAGSDGTIRLWTNNT